jgi:PAS domain S-box-containing protein
MLGYTELKEYSIEYAIHEFSRAIIFREFIHSQRTTQIENWHIDSLTRKKVDLLYITKNNSLFYFKYYSFRTISVLEEFMKRLFKWIMSSLRRQTIFSFVLIGSILASAFLFFQTSKLKSDFQEHHLSEARTIALGGSLAIQHILEDAITSGRFTEEEIFDTNYIKIPGSDPQKYHTAYDSFTDNNFLKIEDGLLENTDVIYAVAVDINGYVPTHNSVFSQSMTGDYEKDFSQNRTKRIFSDEIGIKAAQNTESFINQTYLRDTGEELWDVSVPIKVFGKHWGAFRVGFSLKNLYTYILEITWQGIFEGAILFFVIILCSFLVTRPLRLLAQMCKDANRVALGDTSARILLKRDDEIGLVADSINSIIDYFQESSKVAEEIANGNLSVNISPKSPNDVLGHSFIKMINNLLQNRTQLEKERSLLQTFLDYSEDAIYFKDFQSRFLRISKSQAKRFGCLSSSECEGKTDFDFFSEEHAQPAFKDEQEIIKTEIPIVNKEEQEIWPDGHLTWVSTTKMPLRGNDGSVIGTFGISRDITDKKQMELIIKNRLTELEAINHFLIETQNGNKTDEILNSLLDVATNVVGTKDCGIFSLAESSKIMKCKLGKGWFQQNGDRSVNTNDGLIGQVFRDRKPINQSVIKINDILKGYSIPLSMQFSAGLIPIMSGKDFIGILVILVDLPGFISNDQFHLLTILSQVAGNSVQRARLNEQLISTNDNLTSEVEERKTIQKLLEREKEILNTTLLSINEGVIAMDEDGCIIFINQMAKDIIGCTDRNVLDQPIDNVLMFLDSSSGMVIPNTIQLLYKFDKLQKEQIDYHSPTFITESGEKKLLSGNISPIQITGQQKLGHVVVFQDVTQKQKMEVQSALSQKMESIGQLASGIAHEINTPNQYIGDNLHYLERAFTRILKSLEVFSSEITNHVGKIFTLEEVETITSSPDIRKIQNYSSEVPNAIEESLVGVERVRKIVLAMREFSHPSQKEKRPSDINHGIETTATISRNEWKYVADLETDLDPNLPLVTCQIDEINQVILNMIVNSSQAIQDVVAKDPDKKGVIKISTRSNGKFAIITISDTGGGIPDSIRNRIFDPFFTTKGIGKGTGQGLYLAHNLIVNKHHGHITFESELGKGTTFTIEIPIESEDEGHEKA